LFTITLSFALSEVEGHVPRAVSRLL